MAFDLNVTLVIYDVLRFSKANITITVAFFCYSYNIVFFNSPSEFIIHDNSILLVNILAQTCKLPITIIII